MKTKTIKRAASLILSVFVFLFSISFSTYSNNTYAASNEEIIYNFCINQLGLNSAAACGILANIEKESGFVADKLEYGYTWASGGGYGICQWTNSPRTSSSGRRTNLVNWCSSNGYDYKSLTGQLYFLKHELETNVRAGVYSYLKGVPNTAQGAYDAGYKWCYTFETPKNYPEVSITRGNYTVSKYWPKYGSEPRPDGQYFKACGSSYTSIVEALKSINVDSSYSNRQRIAAVNGYTNYSGTASENTGLLDLLKAGKLINPDGVPDTSKSYFPACGSGYTSIVEALKSIGVDSSYSSRQRIAAVNGYTSYSGTASENTGLLDLLKAGKLINPDGVPDTSISYFPACGSGYTSIVEALKSIGVDSSFAYRQQIAAANNVQNYAGTAEQNTQLLSLLKAGKLVKVNASPTITTTKATTTTTRTTTTTTKVTTTTKTTTTTTKATTATTKATTTTKAATITTRPTTTATTTSTTTTAPATTTSGTSPVPIIVLPKDLVIQAGESYELIVINCDDPENISWISSNKNVADVENGVVVGYSAGEAVIYAAVNNSYCEITITVKDASHSDEPTTAIKGDLNSDGIFSTEDAKILQGYLLGSAKPLNDAELMTADLNGDGIINSFDMVFMRQLLIESNLV